MQIKQVVWFCAACGKANVRSARFCGGCGKSPLQAVQEAAVADVFEPLPEEFAEEIMQDTRTAVRPARFGFSYLQQKLLGFGNSLIELLENQAQKRLHKRFNRRRAKKAAMMMTASACITLAIWLQFSPQESAGYVKWGDFRSFVSQQLVVSPAELDALFNSLNARVADDKASVNVSQVAILERALREKLGDRDIRLFPNPFFGSASEFSGGIVFADVALDHPVYLALRPLLELGIHIAGDDMCMRPYDRLNWSEWQKVVNDLAALLGMEKHDLPQGNSGAMSSEDLKFYLAHLRRKLFLGGIDKLSEFSPNAYPSRLEAFSSLSAILTELNNP